MKRMLSTVVLGCALYGTMAAAKPDPVPCRPQQAVIYRDGYAVLEQRLAAPAIRSAVMLPAGVDLGSVRVVQGRQPVPGVRFEAIIEKTDVTETTRVEGVRVDRIRTVDRCVGYGLHLEPDASGGPVVIRYGTTGLRWQPRLTAEIRDDKRVEVTLSALITSVLDLQGCAVRLASSAGQLPGRDLFGGPLGGGQVTTRSVDLVYPAGLLTIEKDRPALVTLLAAAASYRDKLLWLTHTREPVRRVLLIKNPFDAPICPAPAGLYRQGALVGDDRVEWTQPGGSFLLTAGHEPGVQVERSVDTSERLDNRTRPFHHQISFVAVNRGVQPVRLDVVMPKKVGIRHKTLYHFKREPDRRPGAWFIWELDLAPGKRRTIRFSLDTEHARFHEYQQYEKARFEMF